jgi:hypothetical protein
MAEKMNIQHIERFIQHLVQRHVLLRIPYAVAIATFAVIYILFVMIVGGGLLCWEFARTGKWAL